MSKRERVGLMFLWIVLLSCPAAFAPSVAAASESTGIKPRPARAHPTSDWACSCGEVEGVWLPGRPRVVGGTNAAQGQLPFMAFVADFASSTTTDICSGTVVSPNVILTAGHCTVDQSTWATDDRSNYAVVTGAADWTDTTLRHVSTVSRGHPYPGYNPGDQSSDAGLLVLSQPIDAPSIALPTSADQYLEAGGTGAWIAGWGETYAGSDPSDLAVGEHGDPARDLLRPVHGHGLFLQPLGQSVLGQPSRLRHDNMFG